MERTASLIVDPLFLEGNEIAHHLHDIGGRKNPVYCLTIDHNGTKLTKFHTLSLYLCCLFFSDGRVLYLLSAISSCYFGIIC